LTYPDQFPNYYTNLKPFFLELFNLIPKEIDLHIVINNSKAEEELKEKVTRPFYTVLAPGLDEIWLRDFMGFYNGDEVIKPIYQPDYLTSLNTREQSFKINKLSCELLTKLGLECSPLDVVWDGGNLVANSTVGFIADKIVSDNPEYPPTDLFRKIDYLFDFKPIPVPTSSYDTLGHIDGYMSMLDEKNVCISVYPDQPYLKTEQEYLYHLRESAREEGLNIVDITDYPTGERCIVGGESIESAKGCYVNFLKLNDTIILPEFRLSRRGSVVKNRINKEILEEMGYKVNSIDCTKLSELGGVLHCISWDW
jgi:agmatine/peptidylarginine deiminase